MGVRVSTSSASSFSIISLGTAGEEYSCKASKAICSTLFFGAEASNARSTSWAPEAKAELEANGVTLADYDSILDVMAAETEPQTVLAESATVNYAVYQVLENNPALTVKDAADPLLAMKGVFL